MLASLRFPGRAESAACRRIDSRSSSRPKPAAFTMRPRASHFLLLLSALAEGALAAPDADKTTAVAPCTASSTSGAFFDLSPDMAVAPAEGAKPKKGVPSTDYHARGHDYGYNFTLNICAAVVDPVKDVIGIEKADWRNVSAYYESKGKVFSLG